MKKSTVAMLAFVVATLASPALAMSAPSTFQEAYQKGAEARVEFKVVDDLGLPVSGATINVFFDMVDRGMGRRIIGDTDTNGVYVAEAKTMGVLEIKVSREGYYSSTDRISFIDMGREHEVKDGRWQPWGLQKKIPLLPVKDPQAHRFGNPDWRRTKALKTWIGFDLAKYDFVKPHGTGDVTDMEVFFDWDGAWRPREYNGITVKIRFPDEFAGGYYADKTPGSEFVGVYQADPKREYKREFTFSERVVGRNRQGLATGVERQMFDFSKVLVVRSRCRLDDKGALEQANYFQLSSIQFACGEKGAAIMLLPIFNPTPNETNLEPK